MKTYESITLLKIVTGALKTAKQRNRIEMIAK